MSLEFAKIFNFLHTDTPMHRLDPRAKFMTLIAFSILSFLYKDLVLMVLLFLCVIPLAIEAKMFTQWIKGLGGMSFLIFFILIINSFANSLNFALIIITRVLILMLVFAVYFQTTLPEDLTQSLIAVGVSYQTAFSFSLAFRFVPTMAQETQIIMDAQRSRGHEIQEGGMIQQVKNLFPLLVPLIMNSIRRALNVAEALETRAFGMVTKPTFYYPLQFKQRDWYFVVANLLLLIIGIIVYTQLAILPSWLSWNLTL